jgi:hypothetical protein
MRKLIGTLAIAFAIFAAATRPNDAAVIFKATGRTIAEAANALIDVLVGISH